jgi:hypothetical protein
LSSLKYALDDESLIEITLNTITNAFSLQMFQQHIEKILTFLVIAVKNHPENTIILTKTEHILKDTFTEEALPNMKKTYLACQFLFLSHFAAHSQFSPILALLKNAIYPDEATTESSLYHLADCLHYEYNTAFKVLTLKYFLQLISTSPFSPHLLSYTYTSVLKLPHKTPQLSTLIAKFAATVGLTAQPHPSSLSPRLSPEELDQQSKSKKDFEEWAAHGYKLHRQNPVKAGLLLHLKIKEFIMTTSHNLRNYLFGCWRLECSILGVVRSWAEKEREGIKAHLGLFRVEEGERMDFERVVAKLSEEEKEGEQVPKWGREGLGEFGVWVVG